MQIKYSIIIVLFMLVVAVSCTEEIDIELKSGEPCLVVDAVFTDVQRDHFVKLSVSTGYFSNKPNPAVTGATVKFGSEDHQIVLAESQEEPGVYVIPQSYKGEYGKHYTLDISGVDVDNNGVDESYSASEVLNEVTKVDGVKVEWDERKGEKKWKVLLYSQDDDMEENFYAFVVYLNNELVTDQLSETEYAWDKFFNGNEVVDVWVQSIVEEEDGGETEYKLKEGDWVKLEMQTINKGYYDFLDAVSEETGIKVPLFSGPPADVPTNISNGGKGFFRAYSVSCDSIKITKEIIEMRD